MGRISKKITRKKSERKGKVRYYLRRLEDKGYMPVVFSSKEEAEKSIKRLKLMYPRSKFEVVKLVKYYKK